MARILIVGGVAGGMSAAARLRRNDESAEIIVFEKGEYISYANCGLPYYIGGAITERDKLLVQTVAGFTKRFRVDVRTGCEVVAVDPALKKVTVRVLATNENYSQSYDKLVLSPGAEPVRPQLPGIGHQRIFTLRSIPDTDRIKALLDTVHPKRALIVGAGFIGLEMAENLHARGVGVTIVEMAPQVMNVIDYEMAAIVHQDLRARNIEFYLNESVTGFSDESGRVRTKLTNGREVIHDLVILSIGVRPETHLAKAAGISLGAHGGIVVNEFMQTSDPFIYAVGDAVETPHLVTGVRAAWPLAGPANRQGRIAADNITGGNRHIYKGTLTTAIAKVFDLTVAVTGATEKACAAAGIPCASVIIHPSSHAGYYPGALPLALKLTFSPATGKILGCQGVGYDGVDKRIDMIAVAIQNNNTVSDLTEIDHAYAPPFSSAKDPVTMAGFVAENVVAGKVRTVSWKEIDAIDMNSAVLVDVRTPEEVKAGAISGALNIPLDDLRERMGELPKSRKIVLYCRVGLRGYLASRILTQNGYTDVYNLTGGYLTYSAASQKQDSGEKFDESYDTGIQKQAAAASGVRVPGRTIEVDVCGLQCPGPIIRVKREIDKIGEGDRLSISATDPGFYTDLPAWAKATGNKIISLSLERGIVKSVIEKGTMQIQPESAVSTGNDKTIIVFDGDLDKAIAAFIITNGALAMGRRVTIFFTFWGLNVLRRGKRVGGLKKNIIEIMFGKMLPRGSKKLGLSRMNMGGMGPLMIRGLMKARNVDALEEMIDSAIEGGARLIACQMSMDLMGIKKEELIDGVEVGGVATYLGCAEHADTNLFI
ncbi:MAG: FAD-dependent oxidoreductase [Chitinispirillaceae bacterium]|jgi:NADPH-dependent 2,4-dienoyl-CoA reductase/sulfur reductase-like enzyme/peroxiredoxin family protein/rhodanese-related sulfurtransferase/TusA-related sulfurtransferase|nr:FAD-dependent oxidoreductase [Chitinispirillaceae bacterium]